MDKKIILAKAGAGKTYHICSEIDPNKRNLLIAYTNQNISNLLREISNKHGEIPQNTEIITFHSFIYRYFIRPFELLLNKKYKCDAFRSKGVSLIIPEPARINGKFNPKYHIDKSIKHYYTNNCEHVYLSRMSDLVLKNDCLLKNGIDYMLKFFDFFYIDEVQDFRKNDWKFLEKIIVALNNVVLVGDYYQHSVSGDNNSGIPFEDYDTEEKYKKYLRKLGLFVDEETLSRSRRCPKEVCAFVSKKTGIFIEAFDENVIGKVKEITNRQELIKLLKDDSIMKLMFQNSRKQHFKANNWGNSKGDTYDNTLIILPGTHKHLFQDNFDIKKQIPRNKLYVALTRTRGDLLIVQSKLFKEFDGKSLDLF